MYYFEEINEAEVIMFIYFDYEFASRLYVHVFIASYIKLLNNKISTTYKI